MNRGTARVLLEKWKSHKRGKPMEPGLVGLGNDYSLWNTADEMVLMRDVDIPNAVPKTWKISVGNVKALGWTSEELLQIVTAEEDGLRIVYQVKVTE
ncbi:hypothetical protein TALC_00356 [Thermoplasmatales archaeon BRNA1]|nr:hypothetical protein TALC_00356 [Thermoplasmatales archaeon BRNA1]